MMIPFEDRLEVIQAEIAKRRRRWTLTTLSFEDAAQIVLIHVHEKYEEYDEKRAPFVHWLNRVISNQIKNLLRDNLIRFSRPCLTCKLNLGGEEECGYTKSGKQCDECPLFKMWVKKKQTSFNIEQPLSIESHANETYNVFSDFTDIPAAKEKIDEQMKVRLKPFEYEIYKMLYIENKSPEEVGKALGYKKSKNSNVRGYQAQRKLRKKMIEVAKKIIQDENLA